MPDAFRELAQSRLKGLQHEIRTEKAVLALAQDPDGMRDLGKLTEFSRKEQAAIGRRAGELRLQQSVAAGPDLDVHNTTAAERGQEIRAQASEARVQAIGVAVDALAVIEGTGLARAGLVALERRLASGLSGAAEAGVKEGLKDTQKVVDDLAPRVSTVADGGVPARASLDNVATREWYHAQLEQIPGRLDQSLPLRERALQAFKLRNEIKLQARALMADRATAEALPSPRTLADVVKRAYDSGARGDDIWRYVLRGSGKSNPRVDAALGL